jgi:ABC-2 type transport system permease protein
MSTITSSAQRGTMSASATTLSFGGVVRSEWIKLWSLRSTFWSYLLVILLSLGMAFAMSMSTTNNLTGGADAAGMPPAVQVESLVQSATFGVFFGQLVVAVLGVLVISGEYSTGMIRSTLTAVPKRLPALAAKGLVLFTATFVVGLIATVAAALVSSAVFSAAGLSPSLLDPDVLLPLAAAAAYLALLSVFALGVGTMLRSSAGGIATVVGILLVLPTVLQMIPADWARDLAPYLLSVSGLNMFSQVSFTDNVGEFVRNLVTVLGWVAASSVGGSLLLKKRDA